MHKTTTPSPPPELSIALIVASIIQIKLSDPAYLGTVSTLLLAILYYLWRTTRAMTGLAPAEALASCAPHQRRDRPA